MPDAGQQRVRKDLVLTGDVDLHVSDTITAHGLALLDDPSCAALVVDLTAVTFMDSVGLASLLYLLTTATDGHKTFALRGPQPPVQMLLALTGLTELFTVEPALTPVPTAGGTGR